MAVTISNSYNILNGMAKMTCAVVIGREDTSDFKNIIDPYYLFDIANIEIHDSFNNLVNTAKVTFPRTIKLIHNDSVKVIQGSGDGSEQEVSLIGSYESLFRFGDRIDIMVGYNGNNKYLFRGYITGYGLNDLFTFECEDSGYKLKTNSVEPLPAKPNGLVLDSSMQEWLLKGTGLKVHSSLSNTNITVPHNTNMRSHSAADILAKWKQYGVLSYIKYDNDGQPYLAIGRSNFIQNTKSSDSIVSDSPETPYYIDYKYHVASSNLEVKHFDKMFLAVTGVSMMADGNKVSVTAIRDKEDPSQIIFVNEETESKKQQKYKALKKEEDIKLNDYNLTYHYVYNLPIEELKKVTKAAFENISRFGVEGTITIFGDYGLTCGCRVYINDERNPDKCGLYIVSEVNTSFGQGGYRQTLKLPYKISE